MHVKAPPPPLCPRHRWGHGARSLLIGWLTLLASAALADTITHARFTEPTTRYAHGVLGDDIEYGALQLSITKTGQNSQSSAGQSIVTIRLPQNRVFEDLAPRLVDVDLDGANEVIVVESNTRTGAQLAIYDASGTKIAATPHIGTRFRWLAPVGASDLDRDGRVEIAYVDRPHLAKTLRIWRFDHGRLTAIASLPNLTNHRIGEDFISGGLRDCGDMPQLILASGDWSRILGVSYQSGWTKTDLGPFDGPSSLNRALAC